MSTPLGVEAVAVDVPKEVWEYQVGGYPVCERWLKDRRDRQRGTSAPTAAS